MTTTSTAQANAPPSRRIAVLSAAMAVGAIVGCGVAWGLTGPGGLFAPLVAAVACWGGGLAAVAAEERLRARSRLQAALLAGTGLRLGPAVVVALAARLQPGGLWEAGLPYYLGGFYIVLLGAETVTRLSLWRLMGQRASVR